MLSSKLTGEPYPSFAASPVSEYVISAVISVSPLAAHLCAEPHHTEGDRDSGNKADHFARDVEGRARRLQMVHRAHLRIVHHRHGVGIGCGHFFSLRTYSRI